MKALNTSLFNILISFDKLYIEKQKFKSLEIIVNTSLYKLTYKKKSVTKMSIQVKF